MIFSGDVVIKMCVELGLEDLKNNIWILDDIFSDFRDNPLLAQKYGQKEIQNAKDFLLNNKINVLMAHRLDVEVFPMVSISMGSSNEDKSLATLGDLDVDVVDYSPEDIGKPISWIIQPFNIVAYDQETGLVTLPQTDSFKYIGDGMLLVDSETGDAWVISGVKAGNKVQIPAGSDLGDASRLGIAPKYMGYRARRERIISQENYSIGCHVHGDPATLLFLFALVKYSLLRYREGLLEYNNFQLSTLQCSEMVKNGSFQAENVYSRFITLTGQTEESWIKTPYRHIEAVDVFQSESSGGSSGGSSESDTQATGIKIISNDDTDPNSEEAINDLWVTITDKP